MVVTALRAMGRRRRPCSVQFVQLYIARPGCALGGFDQRLDAEQERPALRGGASLRRGTEPPPSGLRLSLGCLSQLHTWTQQRPERQRQPGVQVGVHPPTIRSGLE